MKFLAVMLMLIFGRYKRRSTGLVQLAARATPQRHSHWLLLIIITVLVELLLLQWFSWPLASFVLAAELLTLYLYMENWSPSDLTGQYYRDWCRGDFEASWLLLAGLLGLQRTDQVEDGPAAHYAICQQYLYLSLSGFFALLFWFACLGVPGLFLALWAGWQLERTAMSAKGLRWVAEQLLWLPAWLLGFSFFLVGNGVGAYNQLNNAEARSLNLRERLFSIALGAIGEDSYRQYQLDSRCDDEFKHHAAEEIISLNKLIRRAAIFWLLLFGVLTSLGIETPFY